MNRVKAVALAALLVFSFTVACADARDSAAAAESVVASINIDADALYRAYDANEVAADRSYKGQKLRISGVIKRIGKDILDTPYLIFGDGLAVVQAMFARQNEAELAGLSIGQKVAVECTCDGKIITSVIVRKCIIVDKPLSSGR